MCSCAMLIARSPHIRKTSKRFCCCFDDGDDLRDYSGRGLRELCCRPWPSSIALSFFLSQPKNRTHSSLINFIADFLFNDKLCGVAYYCSTFGHLDLVPKGVKQYEGEDYQPM